MARKDKKIIEKDPIVVDEKAIITEEVPAEDTIEVETPEVVVENLKKLICRQSFTDKFDDKIVYQIGDELNITDVVRRKDLIERGLAVEE